MTKELAEKLGNRQYNRLAWAIMGERINVLFDGGMSLDAAEAQAQLEMLDEAENLTPAALEPFRGVDHNGLMEKLKIDRVSAIRFSILINLELNGLDRAGSK